MADKKRVVVIGGGTGTYTVLSGLKKYPVELAAVVSMADDGGSNRVIRDEFGLLPTSDIRQCFVALAGEDTESQQLMRELFMYRFHKENGVKGMTFGNLFMAALTDILGSQAEAIERTADILNIQGRVLPATFEDVRLAAEYENGETVTGEHLIDEPRHDPRLRITRLFLVPEAAANPEAVEAIREADLVVLGPGDLYTSVVAAILPRGVVAALQETSAKKVFVLNLFTRPGQTLGLSAKSHVEILESFMGASLDAMLVNSRPFPEEVAKQYIKVGSEPVPDDLGDEERVTRSDFLSEELQEAKPGDTLGRSLIRHDQEKLASSLMELAT